MQTTNNGTSNGKVEQKPQTAQKPGIGGGKAQPVTVTSSSRMCPTCKKVFPTEVKRKLHEHIVHKRPKIEGPSKASLYQDDGYLLYSSDDSSDDDDDDDDDGSAQ